MENQELKALLAKFKNGEIEEDAVVSHLQKASFVDKIALAAL